MFYYYGRKEKVFKYYPTPNYDTIIEPFAGSAVYSLKNFEKNIIILDKDERIINIWNYLKEASSDDILSLPLLTIGQSLNDPEFDNLTFVQKDLISFFTNPSSTWFIDPPYQGNGGKYYKHGNKDINYNELSLWAQDREGQVIVCENSEANWLPFRPLKRLQGQRHKTIEVIWENDYIENQVSLNL